MRLRTLLLPALLICLCLPLASATALAQAPRRAHVADAAPTARSFYIRGTLLDASGSQTLLIGLAKLSVDSTGAYSGTLTTGGTTALTATVTGMISGTMTLAATLGGKSVAVTARSISERIGNPAKAGPVTTAGKEFMGDIMVNSVPAGFVTVIDTSILREYSFAGSVGHGPGTGNDINGGLFIVSDHRGDLQGYLQDDATSAVYPVLSGTLARGQMLVHIDLLGGGNLVGIAAASNSILNNQLVYKGTFFGPTLTDSGTWLSAPPEN